MRKREWVLGWEAKLLVLVTAALVAFGFAAVYSASSVGIEGGRPIGSTYLVAQIVGAGVGGLMLLVTARLNPERLRALAWPLILATLVLLVVLVLPGTEAIAPAKRGARRWLDLGVSVQVSELAKLAVVVWTAMLCAKKGAEVKHLRRGLLPVLTVVGPIALLVMAEPDLSQAVTLLVLALVILFAAGARVGHFIFLALLATPLLWRHVATVEYQVARLTAFLDPASVAARYRYQADQSVIGLGSGGLFGVGFGRGQQKLGFLPEPSSDFIFSTIGEEWGFAGVVLLVALFTIYLMLALRLARNAGDPFRQYLAVGLAVMIGIDAFLHMGVALGIVPNTGLVLPFVSHGRSSLVIALAASGLLVNIGTHRRPVVS